MDKKNKVRLFGNKPIKTKNLRQVAKASSGVLNLAGKGLVIASAENPALLPVAGGAFAGGEALQDANKILKKNQKKKSK